MAASAAEVNVFAHAALACPVPWIAQERTRKRTLPPRFVSPVYFCRVDAVSMGGFNVLQGRDQLLFVNLEYTVAADD